MNETFLLVKKNWIYLTTSIKSALVSSILFCLFMPMWSIGFGVAMPALLGYILIYSIMAYEERSKVELMTAAMPISRKEMCASRYIESIIYLVGGCMIAQIGLWLNFISQLHMVIEEILKLAPIILAVTFLIGAIYNSIILPVIFYFGTIKARYYLMFSYIVIFVGANTISNMRLVDESIVVYINKLDGIMPILMMLIGVIIYYISYRISLNIWKKKDFK